MKIISNPPDFVNDTTEMVNRFKEVASVTSLGVWSRNSIKVVQLIPSNLESSRSRFLPLVSD